MKEDEHPQRAVDQREAPIRCRDDDVVSDHGLHARSLNNVREIDHPAGVPHLVVVPSIDLQEGLAAVALFAAATTMLWSHSPVPFAGTAAMPSLEELHTAAGVNKLPIATLRICRWSIRPRRSVRKRPEIPKAGPRL